MDAAVVGAGPTGLYVAAGLARRGHRVTVVDRDAGPADDGSWARRGVMQFHHPHGFRSQVVDALLAELPEVVDHLYAAGAVATTRPDKPDQLTGLQVRRSVFERVLRSAALGQAGVELLSGHADQVCVQRGRAVGLLVDGCRIDADLVIDASGRSGRLGQGVRGPAEGADCGMAYTSRQHRLLPGAESGPINGPVGLVTDYPGYLAIVFLQDNRTISTLIARQSTDKALAALRIPAAYEAACRAIPGMASWTDPERTEPITDVLPGGRLANSYRGQRDGSGQIAADGLIFVGDSVCTTNPTAGRGVATSLLQAHRLLQLLDEHPGDFTACSLAFDAWCESTIKPWFEDHVSVDADRTRRWSGGDVDLDRRLPSDLILAATEADPSLMRFCGPYLGMWALPSSLAAAEPRAREIYGGGWRPTVPPGPGRDELAEVVTQAVLAA